ncbi:outer membrane protein assembly factor BamE [Sphingomonas sp.]|uniref:outer membrane protein assembly factor BamE n=1 Tax=Sphingomonas sp. TaxID=28214 RepID=UPI003CC6479D
MPLSSRVLVLAVAGVLAPLALGGCVPIRQHQGYLVDADLVNSVQVGVDNRTSVAQTLGRPTFTSQFARESGVGDWYYLARDTHNLAFRNPHPSAQVTLQIQFDATGTVTGIRRGGLQQVAAVSPYGPTTPTLGKKRGFFEDLFGNIGTLGAGGGGAGGAGGAGGGDGSP